MWRVHTVEHYSAIKDRYIMPSAATWMDLEIIALREPREHLLLGRKVMTNLDSIFKSRDITLPTKVCLVIAMVFPVVIYGCEGWTIKKAEHRRTDAFEHVGEDF